MYGQKVHGTFQMSFSVSWSELHIWLPTLPNAFQNGANYSFISFILVFTGLLWSAGPRPGQGTEMMDLVLQSAPHWQRTHLTHLYSPGAQHQAGHTQLPFPYPVPAPLNIGEVDPNEWMNGETTGNFPWWTGPHGSSWAWSWQWKHFLRDLVVSIDSGKVSLKSNTHWD